MRYTKPFSQYLKELNEEQYSLATIKRHQAKHGITSADIKKKVPHKDLMKYPGKTPSDKMDSAHKARNLKLYGNEKGVDAQGNPWKLPGHGVH
jgi:hypothetical protein